MLNAAVNCTIKAKIGHVDHPDRGSFPLIYESSAGTPPAQPGTFEIIFLPSTGREITESNCICYSDRLFVAPRLI